mmetsp:Transcript_8676/g.22332  ORF Transcript_8676/g.22332 Transcript_8676/m.22332 type:complete len:267 (+) Transcript_8676:69-869(+)
MLQRGHQQRRIREERQEHCHDESPVAHALPGPDLSDGVLQPVEEEWVRAHQVMRSLGLQHRHAIERPPALDEHAQATLRMRVIPLAAAEVRRILRAAVHADSPEVEATVSLALRVDDRRYAVQVTQLEAAGPAPVKDHLIAKVDLAGILVTQPPRWHSLARPEPLRRGVHIHVGRQVLRVVARLHQLPESQVAKEPTHQRRNHKGDAKVGAEELVLRRDSGCRTSHGGAGQDRADRKDGRAEGGHVMGVEGDDSKHRHEEAPGQQQ